MNRCELGYEIREDFVPPERCHNVSKFDINSCKECSDYNNEYDLINQAIESAQCRIYRLKQNEGSTLAHQQKAKNQQELMRITIRALEFYRDNYGE
jgi:hypothetical protein